MENFFNDAFEYNIFKKALRSTASEPVVLNISSTDSSLQPDVEKKAPVVARKNFSEKFEPSPFGKYFGQRKKRNTLVDMNDFSAWKNKNYRKVEEASKEEETSEAKPFSLAEYMRNRSNQKFNELDQAKSDLKKPINQLSTDDPDYKKFNLDSYMNKLEEGIIAKNKFEQNEDLLEPIAKEEEEVPINYQDEDFSNSDVSVEKMSFDEIGSGQNFSLDKTELDEVRNRLDRLEKQANSVKEKPNQKIITGDEFKDPEEKEEEDNPFFIKPKTDEESEQKTDDDEPKADDEEKKEKGQIARKFYEVNMNEEPPFRKKLQKFVNEQDDEDEEQNDQDEENLTDQNEDKPEDSDEEAVDDKPEKMFDDDQDEDLDVSFFGGESERSEGLREKTFGENPTQGRESGQNGNVSGDKAFDENLIQGGGQPRKSHINIVVAEQGDVVTKKDLEEFRQETINRLTTLYRKPEGRAETNPTYVGQSRAARVYIPVGRAGEERGESNFDENFTETLPVSGDGEDRDEYVARQAQSEYEERLAELTEKNKRANEEANERIKLMQEEREREQQEYQEKLRNIEETYNKKYEEMRQKMLIDSLSRERKIGEFQSKLKIRESQIQEELGSDRNIRQTGLILSKELRSNHNICNLEMDNKLLQISNRLKREEDKRRKLEEIGFDDSDTENEIKKVISKVSSKSGGKGKVSASGSQARRRRGRGKSKRRIDSDIIGGIDFD